MGKKPKKGGNSDDWENENDDNAETVMEPSVEETVDVPKPPTADTVDDIDAMWSDDDDKKKKKGKKGKKNNSEVEAPAADTPADEPVEATGVKTKAQKAAEKKEREKQKKKESAQKKKTSETTPEPPVDQPRDEPNDDNDEDGELSSKKKKKGKKEVKEEVKPKKTRGPGGAALRELLAQQEQQRQEQEEKDQAEEARLNELLRLHREKEENERLKREKKRQKEKDRILRRKAEGSLLSEKDKVNKARAEQFLRERGIDHDTDRGQGDVKKAKVKILTKAQKKKLQDEERRLKEEQEAQELQQLEAKLKEVVIEEIEVIPDKVPVKVESDDEWDASSEEDKDEVKADLSDHEAEASNESDKDESDEDDESDDESQQSSSESEDEKDKDREDNFFNIVDVADRIAHRRQYHLKNSVGNSFRSPVVCVLGHVDTGKTKILDNLRKTNVQDGEAGGITQQIGATNVPLDCIKSRTQFVDIVAFGNGKIRIPGLLIIDTPGHESFSNLRSRGSSLCDVAILVVDIMHGLENQTRESIKLLKKNKTPFVVALNKIDRLYQWQASPLEDVSKVLKNQKSSTTNQFEELFQQVFVQMAKEELNVKMFDTFTVDDDPADWVPVVPTSAHSGDGMGNLMAQVIDLAQSVCAKRITYNKDLKCTVMEVKAIEGLGKSIDAILVNGRIKNGDMIVLGGQQGPICTHIRQIYTPPSNKDLRTKNAWEKHSNVKGATGVKIVGRGDDIEKALAGLPLYVARREDEVDFYKNELEREIQHALKAIKLHSEGVYVQASTLGSLEALLEFLRTEKIKYCAINIGPVNKRDIMKASTMLEHNEKYGVLLAFDVPVTREAQELADSFKPAIKIFTADIIYHLTDQFTQHLKDQKKKKQDELKTVAIFPAQLRILPNCIFAKRDPIIIGVQVEKGQLHIGSPVCVPEKENLFIGSVSSIEQSSKSVEFAKAGDEVCIKIDNTTGDAPKLIGRHFEVTDHLVTRITRDGLDALKEWFRDEMRGEDWQLCRDLKKTFKIL